MQLYPYPDMAQRSMFYVSKLFIDSVNKGDGYEGLKKTIRIKLLDFTLLVLQQFHSTFHLYEDNNREYMLTDLWELHFVEFTKFRQQPFDIHDPLQRWLCYMDENISEQQLKALIALDPVIEKAEQRLEELSGDLDTVAEYLSREKAIDDQASFIKAAERKGHTEGRAEGQDEKARMIALNLLHEGMEVALIAKVTGLTVE